MSDKRENEENVLAQLEAEKAELELLIAGLRRRLGRPEQNELQVQPLKAAPDGSPKDVADVPPRFFRGLSIPDAIRKYLGHVQEPKAPKDIASALRRGGVHSKSSDFPAIVRTTLHRRAKEFGIENFNDGTWGLSEWRPGGRSKGGIQDSANRVSQDEEETGS